ncbi:hypothetical protein [Alistipes sp.]|uniref:hypothetical protein n=1 Tax=Alistipes sp. TaxID=1872444 RepID=UPI003AB13AF7
MYLSDCKVLRQVVLLPFVFGIIPMNGYSQWVDPSNGVFVEPSTSVSQFMRYGNTPVSPYTGAMDVSVPLYVYEDYEFNVPITLKYVFDGQKPNDPAGSVGLGWILNAGGSITRQINHLPDESAATGNDTVYGFYEMYQSGAAVPGIMSSTYPFWNTSDYFYPMGNRNIEAEPDIFSFNFMGHSGKFMFWGNRRIVVFDTNEPKGNYIIEPTISLYKFTGFVIKTKDGYTYTFGFDQKLNTADDISSYNYKFRDWLHNYNGPQVMWPLVSVKAPSGRTLTLEYEKPDEYVTNARPTSYLIDTEGDAGNPDKELKWMHFGCLSEQKQKSLYLKKISLADVFSVDFNYSSVRNRESYYDRTGLNLTAMTTERLLKSVVVGDLAKHTTIRTITCEHDEGRPNPVPILDRVDISDVGAYEFTYWGQDDPTLANYWIPYKGTIDIDHWGYSNGKNNRTRQTYFPSTFLADNKENITSSEREPDFGYAVCGALRYVYYPTRGRTEFIYEPNDYSAALVKSGLDFGKPYLEYFDTDKIAGGIRIRQVIDYDYNPRSGLWADTMRVRTYSYRDAHGRSTGVLLRSPRYRTSQVTSTVWMGTNFIQRNFMAAADILECIDTDHHIEYKSVTETNRDGSYCRYDYSNYTMGSCADRAEFNYKTPTNKWAPGGIIINDPYRYFYMRPGSRQAARGKMLSKTVYHAKKTPDAVEVPSYMEHYDYNTILNSLWRIRLTRYYWYEQEVITESCLLTSCTKANYFDDGSAMTTHVEYLYNGETDYVTQVKVRDAAGKYTTQGITYYANANKGTFPQQTHYKVLLPGETEYKTTEINKYEYTEYRVTPSFTIPRMVKHWKTHLDKPKTYASEAEQEGDLVLEQTMQPNASRVYESTDRAGNVTTYLYGYGGCNLLAVVRNVSYSDAMAALQSQTSLGVYSLSSSQEAALRSLPQALVTTYSYEPLTGLASVTDPAGNVQSYSYDSHRRLAKIYSGGNLETEFKYQIFNR